MTSYECLEIFMRVHLHFKIKTFDFFKSNPRTFEEKYPITDAIVSRMPNPKVFLGYCVANKIDNDEFFITECLTQKADEVYQRWLERIAFKIPKLGEELSLLKKKNINILSDPTILLYPLLIKSFISWESLTLLYQQSTIIRNRKNPSSEEIEKSLEDYVHKKLKKYSPFVDPIPPPVFKELISK